ncbi:MAG TPA: site-specific integrase [Solirubrobacteraceae bacterium]|nr:site-specific integrase [Solirubrobacteraceae bacterium]
MIDPDYRRGQRPANFGKTYPAEVLTPDEVLRLIAACSNRGPSGLRNRALIIVLWRGGLRVAEALALYPRDVDTAAGVVHVRHGKGDKSRRIGVDPQAAAVIDGWLERRRRLGIDGRSPVFCTISRDGHGGPGRPMHSSYVRNMVKEAAARAGIEKRCHPHGLRHTHAFELANEGTPLHLIQAQLGHTSLATTDRYVRHIAPVALVAAMQARSWPSIMPGLVIDEAVAAASRGVGGAAPATSP